MLYIYRDLKKMSCPNCPAGCWGHGPGCLSNTIHLHLLGSGNVFGDHHWMISAHLTASPERWRCHQCINDGLINQELSWQLKWMKGIFHVRNGIVWSTNGTTQNQQQHNSVDVRKWRGFSTSKSLSFGNAPAFSTPSQPRPPPQPSSGRGPGRRHWSQPAWRRHWARRRDAPAPGSLGAMRTPLDKYSNYGVKHSNFYGKTQHFYGIKRDKPPFLWSKSPFLWGLV